MEALHTPHCDCRSSLCKKCNEAGIANTGDRDAQALAESEGKRQEALDRIEHARQLQAEDDMDGSQTEITNAWYALDEALTICPANHRARFLLVSCAMNAEDYTRARIEALSIYKDLTKEQLISMNDSVLHLSIAHASKMLGEVEDALKFAGEATELYPDDPQAYMVLGQLFEDTNRNHEAEANCRQALLANDKPECQHTLNQMNVFFTLCCLSSVLVRQARCAEAEGFAKTATQLDSSSTLAYRHLADVYHFQKRYDEALQVCSTIREMDPEDEEILEKIEAIKANMADGTEPDGSRSHRSLPRRDRDVTHCSEPHISEDALRAPPPADIDGQRAVEAVRASNSRAASLKSEGRISVVQALDVLDTISQRSGGRSARRSSKGSITSIRGPPGERTQKAHPTPRSKEGGDDGGWGFCCVDRADDKKK